MAKVPKNNIEDYTCVIHWQGRVYEGLVVSSTNNVDKGKIENEHIAAIDDVPDIGIRLTKLLKVKY